MAMMDTLHPPRKTIMTIPWFTLSVVLAFSLSLPWADSLSVPSSSLMVPEVTPERQAHVSSLVSNSLGDGNGEKDGRYESARRAALELSNEKQAYELVYGELSIEVLVKILDAVGVMEGDRFLDIGSGDGALVLGASLLYASDSEDGQNAIKAARGLEIVPGLFHRSKKHQKALDAILQQSPDQPNSKTNTDNELLRKKQSPVEFVLGDIHNAEHDESLSCLLKDTTLAICFATTWSIGNATGNSLKGRRLSKLSQALSMLPTGARIIIVDGRLDEEDGHHWQGDLTVECPDTAPSSIASLYYKV